MYIDRIIFPVLTLGYGDRFGVWTMGCSRKCPKCSNPELQKIDVSKDISVSSIINMMLPYKDKIQGVTITGGEPFDQKQELLALVKSIRDEITEDILIYTGYTLHELRNMNDSFVDEIIKTISILIDGEYIDELNDNKGIRGSSNQKIHILREKYQGVYSLAHQWERRIQNVLYGDNSMHIGIPLRDYKEKFSRNLTLKGISIEEEKGRET